MANSTIGTNKDDNSDKEESKNEDPTAGNTNSAAARDEKATPNSIPQISSSLGLLL